MVAMEKSKAIEYFGGVGKLASQLDISRQAIHAWGDTVPDKWVYKLHYLSEGKLPLPPPPPPPGDRPQ